LAAKIFISYAREDRVKARKLYGALAAAGFTPWLDEEDILPGQDWEHAINQAMKESDFVILCLSHTSVAKQGYVQTEMKNALALLGQYSQDTVYLIPARLDECAMPKSLERRQSADLFTPNGLKKVIKALEFETARRNRQPAKKTPPQTNFEDIGFSVSAEIMQLVERVQFAAEQVKTHLQLSYDAQHQLASTPARIQKWLAERDGQTSGNEQLARREYALQIVDAGLRVLEANQPLVNILSYFHPDIGIGPGNVDGVRLDLHRMVEAVPELKTATNELMQTVNGARWIPGNIRDALLATTRTIQTQAGLVEQKFPSLGV
jgi:TIR domain